MTLSPAPRRARRDPHRRARGARAGAVARRARPARRAPAAGGQRVLRRQHRRHRADGGRGRRPRARRSSRPAIATCCPTCASARAGSSTAPPSPTCPAPSKSSPPTASPCARRCHDHVRGDPRRPRAIWTPHLAAGAIRGVHLRSGHRIARREGPMTEDCPPSSSSAGRTSARARCSTASSASRWPSSRTARASPATARRPRPSGSACRSCSSTPAAGCPAAPTSRPRSAARWRPRCASADVVLFVVDATTGVTDDDVSMANWLRKVDAHVLLVANKSDNDRRENDRWEFLSLGLGDPLAGQRAARSPRRRPARRGHRPLPRGRAARAAVRRRWRRAGGCAVGAGRPAAAARGHRRPAERRQEHAVQPPRRRGPLRGPRHGRHDARRDRHAGRDARRSDRLRRHRGHAPAQPHRRLRRVLLDGPCAAGDRRLGHRPAGDRRHRGGHHPGPAPGRARRCRRLPDRGDAQQVGADRRPGAAPGGAGRAERASCTSSARRRC